MTTFIRDLKRLAMVLSISVGAMLATVAHGTDCYRYISGDPTQIEINDACVQQLGVPPIFVRLTEDGYDLLIPTSTQETTAAPYRRAVASIQWLSSGTNLASTEALVDAMVSEPIDFLPLGTSRIEQINYTLASWLNTSGATTSIASLASNPNGYSLESHDSCTQIPICGRCQFFLCGVGGNPRCYCDYVGPSCCVIGKTLQIE